MQDTLAWDGDPVAVPRRYTRAMRPCYLLFALVGGVLAVRQAWIMDPDQVAVVEVARHYLAGRFELAITGYWGPLSSWLLVPFLAAGIPAEAACRSVLLASGAALLAGSVRLFAASGIGGALASLLEASMALHAAFWCGTYYTGDLALGAAIVWISAWLIEEAQGIVDPARDRRIGILIAVSAFAKGAGLPLATLLVLGSRLDRARRGRLGKAGLGASLATSATAASALLLPWILVLSWHHGRPTFATSAALNHALLSPAQGRPGLGYDTVTGHPTFSAFHRPRPGRITSWECPEEMDYTLWSPFQDSSTLVRQLSFSALSLRAALVELGAVDLVGLQLLAAILGGAWLGILRRPVSEPARVLGIGLGALLLVYAPAFFATRYGLPGWALLLALAGLPGAGAPEPAEPSRVRAVRVGAQLVAGWGAMAAFLRVGVLGIGMERPLQARIAGQLADAAAGRPVTALASWSPEPSAPPNAMGLFVAALGRFPWLGPLPAGPTGLARARAEGVTALLVAMPTSGSADPDPKIPRARVLARVDATDRPFGRVGSFRYLLVELGEVR